MHTKCAQQQSIVSFRCHDRRLYIFLPVSIFFFSRFILFYFFLCVTDWRRVEGYCCRRLSANSSESVWIDPSLPSPFHMVHTQRDPLLWLQPSRFSAAQPRVGSCFKFPSLLSKIQKISAMKKEPVKRKSRKLIGLMERRRHQRHIPLLSVDPIKLG